MYSCVQVCLWIALHSSILTLLGRTTMTQTNWVIWRKCHCTGSQCRWRRRPWEEWCSGPQRMSWRSENVHIIIIQYWEQPVRTLTNQLLCFFTIVLAFKESLEDLTYPHHNHTVMRTANLKWKKKIKYSSISRYIFIIIQALKECPEDLSISIS